MPTIDQLPAATAASDTDELIVSQSGITRKLTRAQLLSGLQGSSTASSGQLLGGTSVGGVAEGVTVGSNLILANGTLSATSTPFVIGQLSTGVTPGPTDLVPLGQNGFNTAVSYSQFMSGLSSLTSVNGSHLTVTPTGSTAVLRLGDFAANTIQKTGAQMQGPLLLASDPTLPLQAATMEYVQNTFSASASGYVTAAGGTITGSLLTQGGVDLSVTRAWSGGTNSNDSAPGQAGLSGYQQFSGTAPSQTGTAGPQQFSTAVRSLAQAYGGTPLNGLLIADNNLDASAAGGAMGFGIQHDFGGSTAKGPRASLQTTLQVQGPTANSASASGQYTGLAAYCGGAGNDNGTAHSPSGVIYGINTVAQLGTDCTFWSGCVGYELDIAVPAGASVGTVYGLHVGTLQNHGVNGSADDIAIHMSGGVGQTAFWNVGVGFGAATKPTSFGPNSTLIKAYPSVGQGTLTVRNGIDFTALNTTGKMMQTPGYTLGGAGDIVQTITTAGPSSASITPHNVTFSPVSDRGQNGFSGFSAQVLQGTISQNPDTSGSRFNTEFQSIQLTVQSTAGQGSDGHSAVGTHVTKLPPVQANGTVYHLGTADVGPAAWSLYGTAVDQMNLPTSIAGPLACQEYDMQVNAIDDAGSRGGYAFNADTKTAVDAAGTRAGGNGVPSYGIPATIAQGFYSTGLNDTWINIGFRAAGNHIISAFDSRAIDGPETTVASNSTGTTVHVANATAYSMGSNFLGVGVSSSNSVTNVQIGAGSYQVIGYTSDGPGLRSGTLSLASALQGTDGNAGQRVARPFYALIMRTGDRIAFDYGGNVQMFYDQTLFNNNGGIHVACNLLCNAFQAGSVSATSGNSTFANVTLASLSASNGVNVTGGFLRPSSFTLAGLPSASSAPANVVLWVSNALKPGEAAGSGTGVLACRNGSGSAWLRVGDYTPVAA